MKSLDNPIPWRNGILYAMGDDITSLRKLITDFNSFQFSFGPSFSE